MQHSPTVKKIPIVRPSTSLRTVCVADVAPKPISWLWLERIARGKLTLISGDPGLGKSLITVALASAVSTGARWPVNGGYSPKGSVILLSDEDAIADTIRPRLDAAGADCSKIHALEMVREVNDEGQVTNRSFSLSKDVERLAQLVEGMPDCALIQIDPISAYLGGTDSHKNADVRALLSPLSELAEKYNVAIVVVTHLNKGSGSAMYRSVGSIAFTAAARTAWAVTKDKDDPARRLMLPVKNNLGNDQSGMAYRVETAPNGAPLLMWEPDPVVIDINDALSNETDDLRSERQEAVDWLETELRGAPILAENIRKMAGGAGHSWITVKRAKKDLGVVSKKCSFQGGWLWYHPADLPDQGDHEGDQGAHLLGRSPFGKSDPLRDDEERL